MECIPTNFLWHPNQLDAKDHGEDQKQDEPSQKCGQQAETKTTRKRWAQTASNNKMIQKQVEAKNSDVVQAAAKQRPQHLKPANRRKFPSLRLANINPYFKPRRPTYTHPLMLNFLRRWNLAMHMWNWSQRWGHSLVKGG